MRRYKRASTQNPFEDLIGEIPAFLKTADSYSTTYGGLFQQLTAWQEVLDSVLIGRTLKKLEKGLARLKDIQARTKEVSDPLADLSRSFNDEVQRATKEAAGHPDGEFELPNWRARVGPLLGEVKKLSGLIGSWYDWLPIEGEVDELNCLESRKLALTVRQVGQLKDLEEVSPHSELGEILGSIDDYFQDAVNDAL
jgi:hypothetical protein